MANRRRVSLIGGLTTAGILAAGGVAQAASPLIIGGSQVGNVSGALIAARWVLTAGHCAAGDDYDFGGGPDAAAADAQANADNTYPAVQPTLDLAK